MVRSLISLLIYAMLFYFLFDQNIAYIAAILLVIIVHEMGHFLFMRIFKYTNVRIFILPLLGAFTSGKKQQVSQAQLATIILAGPVPGIVIGTVLYLMNLSGQNHTIAMLANSFLIINLLNCLPFYPLDGGRLVETLFFGENYVIRLVFGIISVVALLVIALVGGSFILLIIPVFIILELINENRHEKIREYLRHEKISYYTDYENLPDKDYWLIRDCVLFSFQKKYQGIQPGKYEYSIVEPVLVQHVSSVLKVNLKIDLNIFLRMLVLLFYIGIFLGPIVLILLTSAKFL